MRFWEIDVLRGLAIIKMVISNFIFDLTIFTTFAFTGMGFLIDFSNIPVAATTFMFLMGLSLTISYSRVKRKSPREIYKKYLMRGARIFALGILITIITFILFPRGVIFFGVLHFVGASIILAIPLLKYRRLNLVLGTAAIAVGLYLSTLSFDFPWLLWLGLRPHGFYTFDYFPIFPWFGVTLIGLFVGHTLYPNGRRGFSLPDLSKPLSSLSFLGKRSLWIYLAHQPVAIIILLALGLI